MALSLAWAKAADPPSPNSLETIRAGNYSKSAKYHNRATVLNWNIDRGKHLNRILAALRDTSPDLAMFQEVDLDARRTHAMDVARELAQAAGLNYAFAPEFEELGQSTSETAAYQGQATLTRFPIRSARLLRFVHQTGFWKPRPLLISRVPILQRREGGRIALITELDNAGRPIVVYNLHLESKFYEHLRLEQLNEVLADAERYPQQTPVIIAGDFNTFNRSSAVITRLRQAGYRSAFGGRRVRTHVILGALDWVFVRGNIQIESARVLRNLHASDHDPLSVVLRL
jgi:endonuclease/exonuclease/phosphatase family metal-dependent hydrolase